MLNACKPILWGLLCVLLIACEKAEQAVPVTHKAPMPDFVQVQGELFVIQHQDLRLELMPRMGGRIASLKYGAHEFLVTRDQHPHIRHHLWGSVLWTSPQDDWGWPPVDVLDHLPYEVTIEADRLLMTSGIDPKTGYQVVKSFQPLPGENAIKLGYRIYNHNPEPRHVAPWELTRVPPAGLTFFPQGEKAAESGIFYPLKLHKQDDIVWFVCKEKYLQNDHHKLMIDSKGGWMAHADRGHLLVKQFPDVPTAKIAPNEGEIEIFVNAERTYLELQQQGALVELQPGDYLDWEVVWHLRSLPKGLVPEKGSPQLLQLVHDIVQ